MKKRELWLKLFSENDVALACAIHLSERFCQDPKDLLRNKSFIQEKVIELDEEVSREDIFKIWSEQTEE